MAFYLYRMCRTDFLIMQCHGINTQVCRLHIINPRHARMRSEGYNSCLVCVCLSGHTILAVRAIKSIMKDTIVLSVRFAAI